MAFLYSDNKNKVGNRMTKNISFLVTKNKKINEMGFVSCVWIWWLNFIRWYKKLAQINKEASQALDGKNEH